MLVSLAWLGWSSECQCKILPLPADIFQTPSRHLLNTKHLPDTFKTTSWHLRAKIFAVQYQSLDYLYSTLYFYLLKKSRFTPLELLGPAWPLFNFSFKVQWLKKLFWKCLRNGSTDLHEIYFSSTLLPYELKFKSPQFYCGDICKKIFFIVIFNVFSQYLSKRKIFRMYFEIFGRLLTSKGTFVHQMWYTRECHFTKISL